MLSINLRCAVSPPLNLQRPSTLYTAKKQNTKKEQKHRGKKCTHTSMNLIFQSLQRIKEKKHSNGLVTKKHVLKDMWGSDKPAGVVGDLM